MGWRGHPSPYEIAQEVGSLRKQTAEKKEITSYPCTQETLKKFIAYIQTQQEAGFIVPDNTTITIEVEEKPWC